MADPKVPQPPAGYTLDAPQSAQQGSIPPPPPGYTLDSQGEQWRDNSSVPGTIWQGVKDLATGAAKNFGDTVFNAGKLGAGGTYGSAVNAAHPEMVQPNQTPPVNLQPEGIMQNLGGGAERLGEMYLTGKALPFNMGTASGRVAEAFTNSAINSGAHGENPVVGGILGGATAGVLEGGKAAAPALMESALKVSKVDRYRGARPGVAALNETTGFTPEAIETSARQRLGELGQQIDTAAQNSTIPVSARPAFGIVYDAKQAALQRNSPQLKQLADVNDQLAYGRDAATGKVDRSNFLPSQTNAWDLLQRKRGIGDLVPNWNPEVAKGVQPTVQRVYGAMDQQLDNAIPGFESLDSRYAGLKPVADRAMRAAASADTTQRVMNRFAVPTGALTMGAGGAYGGYRKGGIPGAIVGGLAGAIAPEIIANPALQTSAARLLYSDPARQAAQRFFTVGAQQGKNLLFNGQP